MALNSKVNALALVQKCNGRPLYCSTVEDKEQLGNVAEAVEASAASLKLGHANFSANSHCRVSPCTDS